MLVNICEFDKLKLNNIGKKVKNDDLGDGIVVGDSSLTGEPFVFFYSRQEAVCIKNDSIS